MAIAVPNVSNLSKKFEYLTFVAITPTGADFASAIFFSIMFATTALPIIIDAITKAIRLKIIVNFFFAVTLAIVDH